MTTARGVVIGCEMSDNTPEEKSATTPTLTPQERVDAARKASAAASVEYSAAISAMFPPANLELGRHDDDDEADEYDEVSREMFETATELAAEPWSNDELRLRAIVFLTRSAIRVREAHVTQTNREHEREEARERAEAKGRR